MKILATTNHGGVEAKATFTASSGAEFARLLEGGVCGPVFKRDGRDKRDDYLLRAWDRLRVNGETTIAWTRLCMVLG